MTHQWWQSTIIYFWVSYIYNIIDIEGYILENHKIIFHIFMSPLYGLAVEKFQISLKFFLSVLHLMNGPYFLAVTSHWMNKHTKLKLNVLECLHFNKSPCLQTYVVFERYIFKKWNIENMRHYQKVPRLGLFIFFSCLLRS